MLFLLYLVCLHMILFKTNEILLTLEIFDAFSKRGKKHENLHKHKTNFLVWFSLSTPAAKKQKQKPNF